MLINETTCRYIRQHQDDDVRQLALQGTKDHEVDLTQALEQIAGRQTARKKLPSWAAAEGIVYPPHLNMEQCSSEQTARYKQQVVERLCGEGQRQLLVDLTGGFGVDFYWMSRGFKHRTYVEQSEALCLLAEHNFKALSHDSSVCCCTTAVFLPTISHADVIFLDPARRDDHGGRTYGIADCTPNVLELLPLLQEKARFIVLKLSPMLDWRKAVSDLEHAFSAPEAHVCEVHIVSVDNECKELLLVLCQQPTARLHVACVNNSSSFTFVPSVGTHCSLRGNSLFPPREQPLNPNNDGSPLYLYEPNASVMKAGCYMELAERFPVEQVAQNSHLFLSTVEIGDFPGRSFEIQSVSSMNKREINQKLTSIESANISVRNFPLSVQQLRKKLKLKDGGQTYIFATTLQNGEHRLFICRKIS
ncbi:MAG: SAM-dependent methyltransferase [Prevotella sp.]|nr:SAM-dependent methyltransferase [Prevotella sp.]